ncbi:MULTISPECIES: peptidoglycan editing factor PgeF [unclassified Staphylococcus]|uniref:peptidoglycan editing factor PgeF n=1 Tax=unclassified Staphylococcus TaxID=91994 RepID=UPI0021D376DA|nr:MULTISPECIES: peptidoglycan editing factor PgeF [unclassified Staphylococcus]UXR70320.1 peptidoglycan editing factor PgeF [Staphylococcus sp. IVB6246]UXR72386.1 peptidoglycan editing factor PgeF [Staphylococcus sp. IVB6240]UXR74691.1 peptidoglycan editing factor PgeF [Staphylococcus sp. IVB6238]UXR77023.1 peptidoglycan editing factor PgeF [Staphylococcus sp. IVB6233]UXR81148.1 peptidoglycan editing factor PgeF [Staphylococcus sp. IVB6218]
MEQFLQRKHYLSYEAALDHGVTLGFTTRQGGVSPYPNNAFNMARYIDDMPENVTHHQNILAEEIGIPRNQWVFPIQMHGHEVVEVTRADRGKNIDRLSDDVLHGIDGMYTYDSDTVLTMCYADCVPIYFYSPKHHFIGLAHAGWRGTVQQIVNEMIGQFPYDLHDLYVVIGPATSNSYEINDDILSKFKNLPIDVTPMIDTRDLDRHGIDLKEINKYLCIHGGIPESNIYVTKHATSEELDRFFSYRIEKGKTGRMLAFISQSSEGAMNEDVS